MKELSPIVVSRDAIEDFGPSLYQMIEARQIQAVNDKFWSEIAEFFPNYWLPKRTWWQGVRHRGRHRKIKRNK